MMDHQLIILNYLVYKIIIKLNSEKKKKRGKCELYNYQPPLNRKKLVIYLNEFL